MKQKVVAVIPARMASSRFPGKPLAMILDLPMIEHVRRRVALSPVLDDVFVATCDQEIFDAVTSCGGNAVMTKDSHERCTERIEEAAHKIDLDIAVIVQGDEPLFDPKALDNLVSPILNDTSIICTNLISVIEREEDHHNTDIVKTVLDEKQFVMYFSRAPIPYPKTKKHVLYRQTGISAFTKQFLHKYATLPPTSLEIAESIDLLRIIGHGYSIRGVVYNGETVGVDRPDDVAHVERILLKDSKQNELYETILNYGKK